MSILLRNEVSLRENTDDEIVWNELVEQNMYGLERLKVFQDLYRGRHILDVGAHIGLFSRLAALTFEDKQIHCYEPEAHNFELLSNNASAGMKLYPFAVSTDENPVFLKPDLLQYTGRFKTVLVQESGSFSVKSKPIQAIIQELDEVFLLKIDVEGYEYELIQSFNESIWKKVDILMIEWHAEPLADEMFELQGFRKLFHPLGQKRHAVWLKEIPDSKWWRHFCDLQKFWLQEQFSMEKEKIREGMKWNFKRIKSGLWRRWRSLF